jgi:hypothetical protein
LYVLLRHSSKVVETCNQINQEKEANVTTQYEPITDILSDLLVEQKRTTDAVVSLGQALAGRTNKTAPATQTTHATSSTAELTGLILKLANTKGRNQAVDLLAKFDAKSVRELKTEQHAAAIEAAKQMLEGV